MCDHRTSGVGPDQDSSVFVQVASVSTTYNTTLYNNMKSLPLVVYSVGNNTVEHKSCIIL